MFLKFPNFAGTAAVLLSLVDHGTAFWRLECHGITGIGRVDPLVSPGEVSSHVHSFKGGNAISETSYMDDLMSSSCTSCQVKGDRSAYWSVALYFQDDASGQMTIVPEVEGHLTYYKYTPCTAGGEYKFPQPMPNGLQMISGDTFQRNFSLPFPDPPQPWYGKDATQQALAQKAIGFNCLNYNKAPEASLYRHFLPDQGYVNANCPDGLRLELLFPQCWDGKNLKTDDHKSHMAFPDHLLNGGVCPDGFPKVTQQIFYETIYATSTFANQKGKFVLGNGDPTGYGYHGDIIVAWDEAMLAAATEQCGPDILESDIGHNGITSNCPVFGTLNTPDEMRACKMNMPSALSSENVKGPSDKLPGNNPVNPGPGYAKPVGGVPPVPTPGPVSSSLIVPTLSYTPGSSGANPEAGNVFKAQLSTTTTSTSTSSIPPPPPPSTTPSTTQPAPVVPAPPPPPTTTAPPVVEPAGNALSTITTIYTTEGQEVVEVVVVAEEITVTVTAGATPAPAAKREEQHSHGHRHEHGRRGRGHQHLHHRRGGLS